MPHACLVVIVASASIGCSESGVPVCFRDDFNSIDPDDFKVDAPRVGEVTANGRLVISPTPSAITNDFVRGMAAYDLTGGLVEIEIARYLNPDPNTQSELVVKRDDANYFFIGAAAQQFLYRRRIAGVDEDVVSAFDPAVRYWRISHIGGDVVFETSVDRSAWLERRRDPPPFALEAMRVDFEVDVFGAGSPDPGAVEFDNLFVAAPGCGGESHELGPHQP